MYPNPVRNVLNISTGQPLDKASGIQVLDASGKVLLSKQFQNNPETLDVSRLPAGLYLIKVKTTEGEAQYKFVKE
jgi:hypothetical protein